MCQALFSLLEDKYPLRWAGRHGRRSAPSFSSVGDMAGGAAFHAAAPAMCFDATPPLSSRYVRRLLDVITPQSDAPDLMQRNTTSFMLHK